MCNVDCEVFDVNVDVVICIDATGSMSPVIEMVKESALTFHDRLTESLATYNREVDKLRVKVIAYRDFEVDDDMAVEESEFFSLPQESVAFESFVKGIRATGGGDAPESSLDAIALAMRSDWVKEGVKKRHVIMLWTDAPTKEAGTNPAPGVPTDNGELLSWWDDPQEGKMNSNAKRLIVFAPECDSWKIVDSMPKSVWVKTALNDGLREMDMDIILNTLSASI